MNDKELEEYFDKRDQEIRDRDIGIREPKIGVGGRFGQLEIVGEVCPDCGIKHPTDEQVRAAFAEILDAITGKKP